VTVERTEGFEFISLIAEIETSIGKYAINVQ